MRPVLPVRRPPRLPPVVRGACAVVREVAATLQETVAPAPASNAPLPEVLATEAAALAYVADPAVLAAAPGDTRAAAFVEAIDGVLRNSPLDEGVLLIKGKLAKEHERARALGLRGARCGGAAARLRAYLFDRWHPRHGELVDLHDRLYAEGERLMAESRGLSR